MLEKSATTAATAEMNVMDEDSMDSINYIFPDNVTPFVNQVAGHEFTKAKPTIGMTNATFIVRYFVRIKGDIET